MKKAEYQRNILLHDGRTTRTQKEEITVEVKPGSSENTELVYASKGNETQGHKPSMLIIKIAEIPHESYRRKGDDLIYTYPISLEQSLLS